MNLTYQIFYRNFGLRRIQNFISPKTFVLANLPRNSLIHFYDEHNHDIDPSKLYFQNYTLPIGVDFVKELNIHLGKPIRHPKDIRPLFSKFFTTNKKFRYLRDAATSITDQNRLVVLDYGYLDNLFTYYDNIFHDYYKYINIQKTIVSKINELCNISSRNNFIFINVPKDLPSFRIFEFFTTKFNSNTPKIFNTYDKIFLLEIWKWLSIEHRNESIFSSIEIKNFNKVNIVLNKPDGKSAIINLGYLNSYIEGQENTTEFKSVRTFKPLMWRKIFLKCLVDLLSLNLETNTDDEVIPTETTSNEPQDPLDQEEQLEIQEETEDYQQEHEEESDGYTVNINKSNLNTNTQLHKEITDTAFKEDNFNIENELQNIESDLDALETVNKNKLKDMDLDIHHEDIEEPTEDFGEINIPIETIQDEVYKDTTVIDSLKNQVNEYAEFGLLSASDYKKTIADIDKSLELKDPYGSGKLLTEVGTVTKEDKSLNEENIKIVTKGNVIDNSMLQSTLNSYDRDYIKNILHKDILSLTNSIQKAGVIIKNHEIEIDHTVLGTYENHTLELKPLNGQSSIIRFRIPKINEDGTFTSNNNKYTSRKQRVDTPLRKINPTTVALTSYYGKTFVNLNSNVANSSTAWIVKQLNKASMDDQSNIKNITPSMVYDNNFEAPFIYNSLAEHFKGFSINQFSFNFDHQDRFNLVNNETLLKQLEDYNVKNTGIKSRVVGLDSNKFPIIVDGNNEFFSYRQGIYVPLGNIFKVLQLEETKAPIDFSELRIFSKTIPTVVFLGYFIGFRKLVKLLNAKFRTVEPRKNKNIEDHEYAISFKDVSYVFSKKDKLASIILSGLLQYEKQTKLYSLKEFDDKNVYYNLMESKGLTSIYIKEINLTNQLFVDPITKSILEEMHEPITFLGLLIRSSEMLMTYHHPDPQDTKYMRIRGYERVPGLIYKELTAAIRQYNNRNIAGKSKIDMSPYQIWQTLMKDPANKIPEDINPIQNLKEKEVVTYVGEGGRDKDSMNKESRAYHINDMGIISEATVDSSDVGINAYLSANPNFVDMRGLTKENKDLNSSNILSTSAMLAPASLKDD